MSWESEAQRIASALGVNLSDQIATYGSAQAWLENSAPQWQSRGLSLNLESSSVGAVTGEPAEVRLGQMPALLPAGVVTTAVKLLPALGNILPPALMALLGGGALAAGAGALAGAVGGGGLFGSTGAMMVDGVPLGGPGVAEPPQAMVRKAWKVMVHANRGVLGALTGASNWWIYYWLLHDGRVLMWDAGNNRAKIWRPRKHIVISSNPRLSNIRKLDRTYKKVQKMVTRYSKKTSFAAVAAKRCK